MYVGQMSQAFKKRCNDHARHTQLYQPDKSAVTDRSIKVKNQINFKDTMVLARMTSFRDCLFKEATEIQLHPYNFKRHIGFPLNHS
jgi:hypothetical protein